MVDVELLCKKARNGYYQLATLSSNQKNEMLKLIADAIAENIPQIIAANKIDVEGLTAGNIAFADRLTLNAQRIENMRQGVLQIIDYKDPIGEVVDSWKTVSGLDISKVRAPLGVVGVIYEARPNVTVDVVALCIKSGNAVVLRGGADAINTNRALYTIMIEKLAKHGYSSEMIQFIDEKDRSATMELLKQGKFVDVIIPRGGDKLKELVLNNATMPVIASAGGNCHIYLHSSGDVEMAKNIVINAKTQRPTVCNACEQLLIDRAIANVALPILSDALIEKGVKIFGDDESLKMCSNIEAVSQDKYYKEALALEINVKIVDDIADAIAWINAHNTMHSDAIIASDEVAQKHFAAEVDAGCVYINASTRFTDGFEFGFGAEIGISTQKLHARGPLGVRQLTSEKYVIVGEGNIRK